MIRLVVQRLSFLLPCLLGACTLATWQEAPGTTAQAGDEPSPLADYLRSRATGPTEDPTTAYRPWVALVPIHEDAGFRRGVFNLPTDLPRMLEPVLAERNVCHVVPPEAVEEAIAGRDHSWISAHLQELADTLRVDFVVSGILHSYKFERVHIGDPLIGGFKSYVGIVELDARLHGGSPLGPVGSVSIHKESRNRGLGLDLLGKPREGDEQFKNLERMTFGSAEFRATALGEATVLAIQQEAIDLAELLRPKKLRDADDVPRIISVFGAEIYINLGHVHGVQKGYRFTVEGGSGADVPIVEVADVISANVSRVEALRGAEEILPGQGLELIGVDEVEP